MMHAHTHIYTFRNAHIFYDDSAKFCIVEFKVYQLNLSTYILVMLSCKITYAELMYLVKDRTACTVW